MKDPWIPHVSGWRLWIMALAIKNGHCPKLAEERHRKWCVDMGFEPPIGDADNVETAGATEATAAEDAGGTT